MSWRSFSKVVVLAASLSGCTSIGDMFFARSEEQDPSQKARQREERLSESINSKFEWAIQNYEAGRYEDAIRGFRSVQRDPARVERFELIHWYLGMSHFHLGKLDDALTHLRQYLQANPVPGQESQEARVTLLRIHESRSDWPAIATLAAETDRLSLYQQNRALVKLLWAEALYQQKEYAGARSAASDAETILASLPQTEGDHFDPRGALWSRHRWLQLVLDGHSCSDLTVARTGKKIHLEQWVDGYGECLERSVKRYVAEISQLPARWAEKTNAHMVRSFEVYRQRLEEELRALRPPLARQRALEGSARRAFHRILDQLNQGLKNFENQPDARESVERLLKSTEGLLHRFSLPNSP
ncbi:MAG: hypothetical protein HUU37_05825 [Bdellovibrionales bacterium]|nr:hypothetical protein [Bdellovibrionales bacterium]